MELKISRKDEWTEEHDLIVAETVLRNVRQGRTQTKAFEEVANKLNRTLAACSFRWNNTLRYKYETALELAKKASRTNEAEKEGVEVKENNLSFLNKEKEKKAKKPKREKSNKAKSMKEKENYTFEEIVKLMNKTYKEMTDKMMNLENKVVALENENNELKQENEDLKNKNSYSNEDYEQLVKIINKAREMIS